MYSTSLFECSVIIFAVFFPILCLYALFRLRSHWKPRYPVEPLYHLMCSLHYFFCKLKKYTTSLLWDLKMEAWSFLKPVALVTPSDISPLVNQILVVSPFCIWTKGAAFFGTPAEQVSRKETRYHVVGTFSQWKCVTFLLLLFTLVCLSLTACAPTVSFICATFQMVALTMANVSTMTYFWYSC